MRFMKAATAVAALVLATSAFAQTKAINATYSGETSGCQGAPVGFFYGFYDMGDHKNFQVFANVPAGGAFSYVVADGQGPMLEVVGCKSPGGGGGYGCGGQITLKREVQAGSTTVSLYGGTAYTIPNLIIGQNPEGDYYEYYPAPTCGVAYSSQAIFQTAK